MSSKFAAMLYVVLDRATAKLDYIIVGIALSCRPFLIMRPYTRFELLKFILGIEAEGFYNGTSIQGTPLIFRTEEGVP